jgi:hypothetical protein
MDNVAVVYICNSLQSSFEDLLPSSHWDLIPNQTQEIIIQVLIHKYALIWDSVQW